MKNKTIHEWMSIMLFIKEFKLVEVFPNGQRLTTIHRGRFDKVNSDIKSYKTICKELGLDCIMFKNGMVMYH